MVESLITLSGNTVLLNKLWYVTGALLGGYPLAQGSVYLVALARSSRDRATAITLPFVIVASILVFLSPVRLEVLQVTRPSGAILGLDVDPAADAVHQPVRVVLPDRRRGATARGSTSATSTMATGRPETR